MNMVLTINPYYVLVLVLMPESENKSRELCIIDKEETIVSCLKSDTQYSSNNLRGESYEVSAILNCQRSMPSKEVMNRRRLAMGFHRIRLQMLHLFGNFRNVMANNLLITVMWVTRRKEFHPLLYYLTTMAHT